MIALWSALYHVNDIAYCCGPIRLYNAENMGTVNVGNGEYLLSCTNIREIGYHGSVADERLNWQNYSKEGLTVDVSNHTMDELYMELPITGYMGYGIDAEPGTEEPYITKERGAHGDIRIAVPAGYTGGIRIYYKGSAVSKVAELVSGLAVAAAIWEVFRKNKMQKETTGGNKV